MERQGQELASVIDSRTSEPSNVFSAEIDDNAVRFLSDFFSPAPDGRAYDQYHQARITTVLDTDPKNGTPIISKLDLVLDPEPIPDFESFPDLVARQQRILDKLTHLNQRTGATLEKGGRDTGLIPVQFGGLVLASQRFSSFVTSERAIRTFDLVKAGDAVFCVATSTTNNFSRGEEVTSIGRLAFSNNTLVGDAEIQGNQGLQRGMIGRVVSKFNTNDTPILTPFGNDPTKFFLIRLNDMVRDTMWTVIKDVEESSFITAQEISIELPENIEYGPEWTPGLTAGGNSDTPVISEDEAYLVHEGTIDSGQSSDLVELPPIFDGTIVTHVLTIDNPATNEYNWRVIPALP